jgi:flagellar assembly protein FliH
MSVFGHPDPPTTAPRALRRLSHSPVVATTYLSRSVELETMEADTAAAVRQGYDDGYADGLARAAAEAAETRKENATQVAGALSALSQALATAEETDRRTREELQAAAPKLAFSLVETLLGRELALAENPGRDAVVRVLALDEGLAPATVRLNPVDVAALDALDLGRIVNVVADPGVEPGGALVEVGRASLDGQLGPALERVRRILLGPDEGGTRDDRAA